MGATNFLTLSDEKIYVLKRNKEEQEINYDKVLERLKNLAKKLNLQVNCGQICMKIMEQTHNKIPSEKIDELKTNLAENSLIEEDIMTILYGYGNEVIDEIILEPLGGAHRDRDLMLSNIRMSIVKNLDLLTAYNCLSSKIK